MTPVRTARCVRAPGKLLLTGSWAVLEGAPALVVAVDRYAVASRGGPAEQSQRALPSCTMAEVVAAFSSVLVPHVDVEALHSGGRKLGLGSSAAAVVAALGLEFAERHADLRDASVRMAIFDRAFAAHERVQRGGSGVDIAAATYGGLLRYEPTKSARVVTSLAWPAALCIRVFYTGTPARTSSLRASMVAFESSSRADYRRCMDALIRASHDAADAIAQSPKGAAGQQRSDPTMDLPRFLEAAREFQRGLEELSSASQIPLVTPAIATLAKVAADHGAAAFFSGAGGGDVVVVLSEGAVPQPVLSACQVGAGLTEVILGRDEAGVSEVLQTAVTKEQINGTHV